MTLNAEWVKTGLYLITGSGANSLLRFSANGLILVDAKLPGSYRALKSQVRRIAKLSDSPVRVLVLTGHHSSHIGNAAEFMAAGIPVIAQENARPYLPAQAQPDAKPAAPIVTFERNYAFHLGGVEVRIMHPGNAKTHDDAVVYFPDLRVVAVGDLFTPGTPEPDFAGGGSLVEWGPALGQVLELDFDVVVPSEGPAVTRAELEGFKRKLDALVTRAAELVKKGIAKDQLMTQLQADGTGWQLPFTGEQLDSFYAELSRVP